MSNHLKQLLKIMVLTVIVISLGATGIVNAQGNGNNGKNKVTICHVPPGNPANAHTITVSENALDAHLGHGDYEGPCDDVEVVDEYVQLTGVVVEYNPLLGLIRLEDGTLVILYEPTDLNLQPGTEILLYGYQIEEGRFLAMIVTTDLELSAGEPIPRLPVWIDLSGLVTQYNPQSGTFLLDGTPVILTVAVPDDLVIEDGIMLTVHGEMLTDGRLLADDVSVYVAPETDVEIPAEGPVTICHVPPGNSNNAHTITVDASSVSAHLAHGDYLDPCGEGESAEVITGETTVVQTTCEGVCNPVLIVLADYFEVAYTDLVTLQGQGYGLGEIARFYLIAELADADVDEIVTLYAEGNGWGQILEQYPDINPSDFRASSNLGNGRQ